MGGKASKYGSIAITLDEPYSVAGGYVRGKVHLDCKEAFSAKQILLIIDAKEWANVQDKNHPEELFNTIYGSFMVLHYFSSRVVDKGQYTFPFSFMVESYLPGTFSLDMNKKEHAKIKYFLRTELVSDNKDIQLKHSTELVVRQVNRTGTKPPSIEEEHPTKKMCFIPQGFGVLSAYIDKNVYMAGETALLTCSIDNMRCSSAFKVKTQLVQTVTINGQNNNPYVFRNVIHEEELPIFRRKQVSTYVVNVPLRTKKSKALLQPSTNGRVINCRYHIEIIPRYTTFFSSTAVHPSILPVIIQAVGGITEIEAPGEWKPTTFDSKLLLIPGRESFERRDGLNPYAGILEDEESFN